MKVYAFVGPSGTGKSYRAQMIAGTRNINYIIDDGLIIKENRIIAGSSAKKAGTKIETVKLALFSNPDQQEEVRNVIEKYKPESIMILGTSDNMVSKIAENLNFPKISETIYITDVATEEEIEAARKMRVTEGKHVIPVPTFEIKKDFSGYLLDPLQIFKSKGRDEKPYITEKSLIRPTFSYLGNYQISDTALRQIIEHIADKTDGIGSIFKIRINNAEEGITIYGDVSVRYGYDMVEVLKTLRNKIKREIEQLTAMYVESVHIVAKTIIMPEDTEK